MNSLLHHLAKSFVSYLYDDMFKAKKIKIFSIQNVKIEYISPNLRNFKLLQGLQFRQTPFNYSNSSNWNFWESISTMSELRLLILVRNFKLCNFKY